MSAFASLQPRAGSAQRLGCDAHAAKGSAWPRDRFHWQICGLTLCRVYCNMPGKLSVSWLGSARFGSAGDSLPGAVWECGHLDSACDFGGKGMSRGCCTACAATAQEAPEHKVTGRANATLTPAASSGFQAMSITCPDGPSPAGAPQDRFLLLAQDSDARQWFSVKNHTEPGALKLSLACPEYLWFHCWPCSAFSAMQHLMRPKHWLGAASP